MKQLTHHAKQGALHLARFTAVATVVGLTLGSTGGHGVGGPRLVAKTNTLAPSAPIVKAPVTPVVQEAVIQEVVNSAPIISTAGKTATRAPLFGFSGNVDLERIAMCESGGSYTAQNRTSTASGKYQFLNSTWGGYGGYARAADAPPSVQDAKARQVFAARGAAPWASSRGCWGR